MLVLVFLPFPAVTSGLSCALRLSEMFGKKTGEIVAVRRWIPWRRDKSTKAPHDSSVAGGFFDISARIHASNSCQISPVPNQQLSTVAFSSKTSHAVSFRNASDAMQITLPVVQEVVGLIPIAGAGLKAAISGFLAVLKEIDQRAQNKAGLSALTCLLYDLSCHLINAPTARTPSETARRHMLKWKLEESANKLSGMRSRIMVGSPSLAAEIAGCSNEIHSYLYIYQFSSQMDTQAGVERILTILERGQSLPLAMASGCVIVVDATGREHNMLLDQCSSFDRLVAFLPGILNQCRPDEARIQRWYINRGQYDFVIDDGMNITKLIRECDAWTAIQPGTKIVVRVIMTEVVRTFSAKYRCCCGTWNELEVDITTVLDAFENGRTITCHHCQRRFQITSSTNEKGKKTHGNTSQPSDDELMMEANSLIRNFLAKQMLSEPYVFVDPTAPPQFPKVQESPDNAEVLHVWRSITSRPSFKSVDINELSAEFVDQARCDGTKVVLTPEAVHHIIEKFEMKRL